MYVGVVSSMLKFQIGFNKDIYTSKFEVYFTKFLSLQAFSFHPGIPDCLRLLLICFSLPIYLILNTKAMI